MDKLSARQWRERTQAIPSRIAKHRDKIAATLPSTTAGDVIESTVVAALRAVDAYLALLPTGTPERHAHRATVAQRYPTAAHRPNDPYRHALIGDLYDAYMSVRGDDPAKRGFRPFADSVLTAAGLAPVTEHEQTRINEQIRLFAEAAIKNGSE